MYLTYNHERLNHEIDQKDRSVKVKKLMHQVLDSMRDRVEQMTIEPAENELTKQEEEQGSKAWKPLRQVPQVKEYVQPKPRYENLARNLDK